MTHYKLNKQCKKCGARILDKNKTGFCNIHRDRTGKNNPFYGKKHKEEAINKMKAIDSINSKKLWQNSNYRKKVIDGVSKPRREGFKAEQSERIKQWYKENQEQRNLRSIKMKKSWENGIIIKNGYSCNYSQTEIDLFNEVKKIFPMAKRKQTLRDMENKWIFPDILIEHWGTIIELFGNLWHANPKLYQANDIVYGGIKAQDIWDKDKKRIERLRNMPNIGSDFPKEYNVIIVWEDEYKSNKELILKEISERLNYEYSY